jgi:hypothetical protein
MTIPETSVVRADHVDIRSVWPRENGDFTPWLADHLDWLAEDLDLGPLTLEATEVPIPGGRALDILASDSQGRAVAIENQYGIVDHDHLTRALAYAVALQSSDRPVSAVIVIAEGHRDEFMAVADYLNECAAARADQGIRIFLVTVGLERVGNSPVAVRFEAISEPNDWEVAARKAQQAFLSSVDAFFDLLSGDEELKARTIVEDWNRRNGTWVNPATNSLVLFSTNPRVPQQRCHVASLYPDQGGTVWLNPGRLEESQAFDESEMLGLKHLIEANLPPTTSSGKGYYLAFPLKGTDPVRLANVFDWVVSRLDEDPTSGGTGSADINSIV